MQYHVIGLMSGSSLDGLDIAYVFFEETAGQWQFDIRETACIPYSGEWKEKLSGLNRLSARDYLLAHAEYGQWLGMQVNHFLEEKNLAYRIQLIASHGHTAFHIPARKMTAQLGDGAALAAVTGIRTITDFRSVDLALGGQGAPIVPIGEKLLFSEYDLFLNIGGIANLSVNAPSFIGFDICPANRVLNLLAADTPKGFDEHGDLAARGIINSPLLKVLNGFGYYQRSYPKSLSNEFGLDQIYPVISGAGLSLADGLATYTEHITEQVSKSVIMLKDKIPEKQNLRLLITGGGGHNRFLVEQLTNRLSLSGIDSVVPSDTLVDFKEALIIALMGVLRWREEVNVLSSVTGAVKNSINGAVWSV